jgi:hypothetical protein
MGKFNIFGFIDSASAHTKTILYYGWAPLIVALAIKSAIAPMSPEEVAIMQKMMQ